MAAMQDLTHHQRQATRHGLRLFGLCLFVVLTLAACGSDSEGEETSAGAGAEDAAEASDSEESQVADSDSAASSDAGAAESDSDGSDAAGADQTDSASTESTTTAPTEGSTTSVDSTTTTDTPDTTAAEDPLSTVDKSSLLANPDDTKPSVAPPTTVAGNSGDPLVDQVIGMTESAAIDLIRSTGRKVRVERRDGEEFMLTQDFEPDRLNLTVVNNSVTSVRLG